ncbi:lipoprotein insertase outer membrane protein LolB [Pseudofulvimonas gallinarii]|jgi:outer membrane lipoprotein LolB|uniref:lipoprotein insertase outer membrane protein LolB n=1 Tax=Pseudofulvimonas gallinarii TaxID=634155 RepID=UPI001053AF31|nr:lipoprotein insertase outer membrane protein LolB [Pseudofulvimonas gallinarii]THD12752.1 outer membrane lipoprotein LolB [Pseudofulvimonas gallinarii]
MPASAGFRVQSFPTVLATRSASEQWTGRTASAPRRPPFFRPAVLAVLLLLAACASTPRRDAALWQSPDGVDPSSINAFRIAGRLAVSDGRDGGSASFVWVQRGGRFEFELRQPVSQKTWRLSGDNRGARLEGGEGGTRHAGSAEALLSDVLGWHVPVAALRDWVRGLPHDGTPMESAERDGDGRLHRFSQDGWQVAYTAWREDGALPVRIRARQANYSVRLNIQDWAVARE